MVTTGAEKVLATLSDEEQPDVAVHLDLKNVKVSVIDGVFLKVTFETRGPVLAEGDPGLAGSVFPGYFDGPKPLPPPPGRAHPQRGLTHPGSWLRGELGW